MLALPYMRMCGGVLNVSVARPCDDDSASARMGTEQRTALTHTLCESSGDECEREDKRDKMPSSMSHTGTVCATNKEKSAEIIGDALQQRQLQHRGLELTHEIIFFLRVSARLPRALPSYFFDSTLSCACFFSHSTFVSSPSIYVARYSIYLMRHSGSNCNQQQPRSRREYFDRKHTEE